MFRNKKRQLPEPDYRIFGSLMVLLIFLSAIIILINNPSFQHDANKDKVVTDSFFIGIVTLCGVLVQIALAALELNLVRIDLARSLRESELWVYGLFFETFAFDEDSDADITSAPVQGLFLNLWNDGDKHDLLRTVIVGVHSRFHHYKLHPKSKLWKEGNWVAASNGSYANFIFYKLVDSEPIYVKDFIELPVLMFQFRTRRPETWYYNPLDENATRATNIFVRVSYEYGRNPQERYHYAPLRDTIRESKLTKPIDVRTRRDDGKQIGPFNESYSLDSPGVFDS
jgi:hypothetical protein